MRSILPNISKNFEAKGIRLGIVANSWEVLEKRMKLASSSIQDPTKWGFLGKQFIFISDSPPNQDQLLAHMYPGQGSQYVGMTHDLSKRFRIIGETWKEADIVMNDIIGEPLSEFVLRSNLTENENAYAEEKLKQTEYTQPAMLTADLAIERLLNQNGIEVSHINYDNKIYVADFFFTTCPSICPIMTGNMVYLQNEIKNDEIMFASFSVTPEID